MKCPAGQQQFGVFSFLFYPFRVIAPAVNFRPWTSCFAFGQSYLSSSTILLTWGILFGNKPFIIIHSKCRKWSRRIVGQEHGGGNPLRFLFLCLLGACALSCTTSPRPACVLNISKLFSELLTTIGDRLMTPNSPKLKITRDTRLLVCDSSRFQMLYPSGRI